MHGALPFIATVICMVVAEELAFRTFATLERPDKGE
jgi:hypothetical protein